MEIHIGSLIRKVVYDKRIGMGDLAKKMGVHPGSIGRILDYPSMQLTSLRKFCEVLDYDFFAIYSEDLKVTKKEIVKTECEKMLEESKNELEKVKLENAFLKEINELLKKK